VIKTLKITHQTHEELAKLGTVGDTFETLIKKLVQEHAEFDDIILQFRLVGGEKREVHIKNPLYYWTPENYDFFLEKLLNDSYAGIADNILKRIANNDEWFNKVQKFRESNRSH
jgi:hypothetical protein